MSDPLLTTLCSICHVRPHRYRCPRCFTLTCSLPCIKRHKQWAQCNGVRDPTAYIKQKDLATPKSIDHDYNYLTSIEREIDQAEKNATSRGFILGNEVRPKGQQFEKGELNVKTALERCGVIVARAPKGMSRSKQNATQWAKRTRTLRWTVEWVQPDGTKALSMCPENQPISEAYTAHLDAKKSSRAAKKRKPNTDKAEPPAMGLEDKPHFEDPPSEDQTLPPPTSFPKPEASQTTNTGNEIRPSASDGSSETDPKQRLQKRKVPHEPSPKTQVEETTRQQLLEWRRALAEMKNTKIIEAKQKSEAAKNPSETPNGEEKSATPNTSPPMRVCPYPTPPTPLTFHLHHPSLPSSHPVLIPLPPDAILATSLTNRLVLEFPTIYVLPQTPDGKLPEGLISEEEFFEKARKELSEDVEEGEVRIDRVGKEGDRGERQTEEGEVDEKRLLEVLGKDLGGVAGVL